TLRDIEIIQAVQQYRALTTAQIEALFFSPMRDGRPNPRCQMRLKHLFHRGYLARYEQPQRLSEGRKPLIYLLDRTGAQLLVSELGVEPTDLGWRPGDNQLSPFFLDHLLATNEVRIAFTLAARDRGWKIDTWIDDKALRSREMKDYVTIDQSGGRTRRAAVVPDGYFTLTDGRYRYHHLLEIDRATTTGQPTVTGKRSWQLKVQTYLAYWRSGLYQKRYETTSYRVLTVTTGPTRLENLKRITEAAGGGSVFWFTTFGELARDTVIANPIWRVAGVAALHALTK
ncbi:hypothetical protein FJY71_08845, partial [candidate division WOR-3 bacterium]|nr:hypothetical protein [candidate division WOR-3 bacterium]